MYFCKTIVVGVLIAVTMSKFAVEGYTSYQELCATNIAESKKTQNISIDNSERKQMNLKPEILSLVNNDQSAKELIKTTYKKDELKTFISLNSALQEQPPECVRVSNDILYFIYKCEEENYLFLMYNFEDENSFPISFWYLDEKIYCKDFENLADRKASFKEVQELDPHGDYRSYYVSSKTTLYSLHHTVDGYLIRLEYSCGIGEPLAINKIAKFSGEDNPIFYNLLAIDKELINE